MSNYDDAWPYDASNGADEGGGGVSTDNDGDGIENDLDPAPDDPDNYSLHNGGSWYSYALEDADDDGTSNFYDPWPYDTYDNLPDFDGDGWLNADDPFPKDDTNYSEVNQTAWGSTMFDDPDGDGLFNWQDESPNDISDSDGDTLDDSVDPDSGDSSNTSPHNGISWGADALGDNDGDSTLNYYDPWPDDSANGTGTYNDSDWDGLDDTVDPAPGDSTNYSYENGTAWYSDALGDADYDGIINFYDYDPYGDSNVDSDGDGFFDSIDPAPGDDTNYSWVNGQWWYNMALGDDDGDGTVNFEDDTPSGPPPVDADGDGLDAATEAGYGTSDDDVDSDDDSLSDGEEVNIFGTDPTNAHHLSQQRFGNNLYTDWQLVDLTDTDDDDIPDRIEQHYGLNPNWAKDALLDRDNDGVNNLTQYHAGIALDANLSTYDADGDSMTDVFEDAHSQVLSKSNPADAVLDADGDGVLNFEEQILLISPQQADTLLLGGLGDLQVLMLSVRYPDGSNPPADDINPQNGIPDWADAIKDTPTAPDYHHFTRQLPGDLDGDGMPDAWEHEFGRWKFTTNGLQPRYDDAGHDADDDGLTNLSEYILDTNPLAGDSDDNGTNDKDEDFDADGLTNGQEIALGTNPLIADTDADGVSDSQETAEGTDPLDATSNIAAMTGLRIFTPISAL